MSIKGKYRYLSLKGGGAKGGAYIGLGKALEKLKILKDLEEIAGSSAGAISALLFATGWSADEIQNRYFELDLHKMATQDSYFARIPIIGRVIQFFHEIYNARFHFGLHQGQDFYQYFRKVINEVTGNPDMTFKQWHQYRLKHPEKNLKDISVEACNLKTGFNEVFSYRSKKNANVKIADAIRASMAFHGFFTPWKINGVLYADGGAQKNLPVEVFEKEPGVPNPEALNVWIDNLDNINFYMNDIEPPGIEIDNPINFAQAAVESALNSQGYDLLSGPYRKKLIYVDTLKVSTLDFNLSLKEKQKLAKSGEYGTYLYFYRNDPSLLKKHVPQAIIKKARSTEFSKLLSQCLKHHINDPHKRVKEHHNIHDLRYRCLTPLRSLKSGTVNIAHSKTTQVVKRRKNLTRVA